MNVLDQCFGSDMHKIGLLKLLAIIIISLILIIGLSACVTVKSISEQSESKNLYQDNNSSLNHVQSSPSDKLEKADKKTIIQKAMKLQMPFIANEGQMGKEVSFYERRLGELSM